MPEEKLEDGLKGPATSNERRERNSGDERPSQQGGKPLFRRVKRLKIKWNCSMIEEGDVIEIREIVSDSDVKPPRVIKIKSHVVLSIMALMISLIALIR